MVYPDSVQEIRLRRLDEAPVAWSVGEDALADYEEGDDLYQYLYRVNGAEPIEGRKDSLPVILQSLDISTE